MAQIGNIEEIKEIKSLLIEMTEGGVLQCWELPYENILTRREAALFFFTPKTEQALEVVRDRLASCGDSKIEKNTDKTISMMSHRLRFD